MSHGCHAIGCRIAVPRQMFMCARHWFSLARATRSAIWRYYRPGQCDDLNPSRAYCDAAKKALIELATREGITVDPKDPKLLLYDWLARGAT